MKCQTWSLCILLTGSGARAVPDFVWQTAPIFSKSRKAVILWITSPSRQCDWVPRTGRTWIWSQRHSSEVLCEIKWMNKAHKEIQRSKQNATSHLLAWCKKSLQIFIFLIPWSLELLLFWKLAELGDSTLCFCAECRLQVLQDVKDTCHPNSNLPNFDGGPGSSPLWHPISWDCRCSSHHAQSRPQSPNQKKTHWPRNWSYPVGHCCILSLCTSLPFLAIIMFQMVQWKMAPYPVVMSQWPPSRPLPRQQFFVPSVPIDSATPLQETMVVISKVGTRWFKKITNASKYLILLFHYKSIPPPNPPQKKRFKKKTAFRSEDVEPEKLEACNFPHFLVPFVSPSAQLGGSMRTKKQSARRSCGTGCLGKRETTGGFWFTELEGSTPCNIRIAICINMSQYCFENSDRFKSHLVDVSSILSFGIFWLLN